MEPSPAVAALGLYAPNRHPAPIDLRLSGNEGAPPRELDLDLDPASLCRYPDARPLEALLADRMGLEAARVVVTAGADDALFRACTALLGPGREIVLPVPTFEMLPRYVTLSGGRAREVGWMRGAYPMEAVLACVGERTAAIAVVSPNNPTGAVATADDLRRLSQAAPGVALLVDLAYAEFADEDLTETALSLPNTLLFRTLSKAWGVAGLRVGYAAGSRQLVDWLRVAGNPYAVSSVSLAFAERRLSRGIDGYVAAARRERGELQRAFEGLGVEALPSQGNFVLARPPDARWLADALAGLGIGVRGWPGHAELDGWLRITCPGDGPALERLIEGIRAALAPEALLFDLDGVIADPTESYRQAMIDAAAAWGVGIDQRDIAAAKLEGHANNDWVLTQRMLAARGVEADLAEVTARFEASYAKLWPRERLLCERGWLAELAQRYPLGVVTGRPRRDAERFLEQHGIRDLFRAVVCMEDAPLKPDPAPVLLALERLGLRRAWLVGDTPDDIVAARAARVVPLGVGPAALLAAGAARTFEHVTGMQELLP